MTVGLKHFSLPFLVKVTKLNPKVTKLTGETINLDTTTLRPGVVNVAIINSANTEMYAERLVFI